MPPPPFGRHAAIAVAWELQGDLLDGSPQGRVLLPSRGVVVRAGGQIASRTQQTDVEVLGRGRHPASLVRRRQLSSVDNFFAAANSTVS